VKAAVVKRSITRFAADSMHPDAAQELIREQATRAVSDLGTAAPPRIARPVTMEIAFRTSDYCELAARIDGIERSGTLTARLTDADPLAAYRSFITAVLLCRGLVE
jgi:D-amino peptidase